MAVHNAFGIACGTAGVTHCGGALFIEIGPVVLGRLTFEQLVVANHILARGSKHVQIAIAYGDHGLHRAQVRQHGR